MQGWKLNSEGFSGRSSVVGQAKGGWKEEVAKCIGDSAKPINFVGVGNPLRTDDGAGLQAVSSLSRAFDGMAPPWVKIHSGVSSPERVLSKIPSTEGIIIFDAVQARLDPGGIVCATLGDTKYGFFATHNVPLKLVPGLAERKDSVFLFGIEPGSLEVGEGLTDKVRQSVHTLVAEVVKQVRTLG
jgi:hydrogenase maturation protease